MQALYEYTFISQEKSYISVAFLYNCRVIILCAISFCLSSMRCFISFIFSACFSSATFLVSLSTSTFGADITFIDEYWLFFVILCTHPARASDKSFELCTKTQEASAKFSFQGTDIS